MATRCFFREGAPIDRRKLEKSQLRLLLSISGSVAHRFRWRCRSGAVNKYGRTIKIYRQFLLSYLPLPPPPGGGGGAAINRIYGLL